MRISVKYESSVYVSYKDDFTVRAEGGEEFFPSWKSAMAYAQEILESNFYCLIHIKRVDALQ